MIEIDPDKGFRIIDKENKQILFDTDPNTGEIRISGTFRVYSKNNPEMTYDPNDPNSAWTIEDKINEIEEEIENIELTPGPSGKTAYEIAVEGGFNGSEQEWINSLVGEVGPGGKTAYELALDNGFSGSQEEWLNSLAGEDAYKVEILSTRGNQAINGDIDTLFYAKLYKGKNDITEQTDEKHFNWIRISEDTEGDNVWNESNKGRKEIHVTSEDVNTRATFRCNIVGL